MEIKQGPKKLKRISEYLPEFIKFYKIKIELIAPLVFIFILGAFFIRRFFEPNNVPAIDFTSNNIDYVKYFDFFRHGLFLFLSVNFIVGIFSSIYLSAYIKDLKGEVYSFKSTSGLFLRNLINIILSNIDFYLTVLFGVLLLLNAKTSFYVILSLSPLIAIGYPGWVFIKYIFLFSNCYILDKGKGIKGALKSSMALPKNNRLQLLLVLTLFFVLIFLSYTLIISVFSTINSNLAILFIAAFESAIFRLMQVRLVALMYVDLEYGQVEKKEEIY